MNKTAANRTEWDLTRKKNLPRGVMLMSYSVRWDGVGVWRVATSVSKVARRRDEVGLAVLIQGYSWFPGQCHNAQRLNWNKYGSD
jgi:hypothetical protein